MDWLQIGKGVHQDCILSSCLFNICQIHHECSRPRCRLQPGGPRSGPRSHTHLRAEEGLCGSPQSTPHHPPKPQPFRSPRHKARPLTEAQGLSANAHHPPQLARGAGQQQVTGEPRAAEGWWAGVPWSTLAPTVSPGGGQPADLSVGRSSCPLPGAGRGPVYHLGSGVTYFFCVSASMTLEM